jgi:hypothetical protein
MSMTMRDTIHQSISRSNRNTAIISIIAIVIAVAAFALVTSKFIFGYFGSSVTITDELLTTTTTDSLPLFNTTVSGDAMYDSGWVEETTTTRNGVSTGKSTTGYFGFLLVGEHLLLIKTPLVVNEELNDYKGVLTPLDKVGQQVYDDYVTDPEYKEVKDLILPMMVDTDYDKMPWFLGAGVEALLALGGLFGLATAVSRSNPNNHPILKRMARFGDTESVMSEIDNEMMSGEVTQVDKLQFTRNWIIYKSGNDMQFARLADVMWVYKFIMSRNGAKTYSAYIWERSGQMLNVTSKDKNVDAMIVAVLQRAPWAIAGHNKDVEKAWKGDRAGFIRTVDDRRAQMSRPQ